MEWGYVVFLILMGLAGAADVRTYRVPAVLSAALAVSGIAFSALQGWRSLALALATGVGFFLFGLFLYRLGGMGGADVELMAITGLWLGPEGALVVILLAAAIGVVWGLYKWVRLGIFRERVSAFAGAIYLRAVYRVKTVVGSRLPDDPEAPVPPEAVPFAACLAASSALYCVIKLFGGGLVA
ncbi:A24 family peptidase [Moorellaceae bacterium AZ2]